MSIFNGEFAVFKDLDSPYINVFYDSKIVKKDF